MKGKAPGMTPASLLISVPQAAEILGIGKSTCWELIAQGTIPTIKLGKRRLVVRRTLENLVNSGTLAQ
jgi:excisionase family DNA binding protein